MNPQENQEQLLTGDESAAALSFATMLSQEQMPKAEVEMPEESEEAPAAPAEEVALEEEPAADIMEEEVVEEPVEEGPDKIDELSSKFDEFKGEVKGMIETKLGDLTNTIKDAIKEE